MKTLAIHYKRHLVSLSQIVNFINMPGQKPSIPKIRQTLDNFLKSMFGLSVVSGIMNSK